MTTYKPLETEFVESGFLFRLMQREDDVALFHKVAQKGYKHPASYDAGFETVKVLKHNERQFKNKDTGEVTVVEPTEAMPSPEMWGSAAWSFSNLYAAQLKYEELLGRKPAKVIVPDVTDETGEVTNDETETTGEAPRHRGRQRGPRPVLNVPEGEFSTNELAAFNQVEYPVAVVFIKEAIVTGTIKFTRSERRSERGKETNLYTKVDLTIPVSVVG